MVKNHSTGNMEFTSEHDSYDFLFTNGKIGVGTTNPTQKLDIQSSNSAGTIVQIRDNGDDYPVGITYNHQLSGHHTAWYAGTMAW